jgi:hypothetical protein
MKIVYDGDTIAPEILISLTPDEMRHIGTRLMALDDNMMIGGSGEVDDFYPNTLSGLAFELVPLRELEAVIGISLENGVVYCRGGVAALGKLGQSLLNYFGEPAQAGDHLHIDYHEGSQLLAPTQCHLIIERRCA